MDRVHLPFVLRLMGEPIPDFTSMSEPVAISVLLHGWGTSDRPALGCEKCEVAITGADSDA